MNEKIEFFKKRAEKFYKNFLKYKEKHKLFFDDLSDAILLQDIIQKSLMKI